MGGWFDKKRFLLRWAERVWPPRNEAQPNREGVASGSAMLNFLLNLNHKIVKSCDVCKEV